MVPIKLGRLSLLNWLETLETFLHCISRESLKKPKTLKCTSCLAPVDINTCMILLCKVYLIQSALFCCFVYYSGSIYCVRPCCWLLDSLFFQILCLAN